MAGTYTVLCVTAGAFSVFLASLFVYLWVRTRKINTYVEKAELELRKGKNNIPKLYYRTKALPFNCSLTHHGNYGGFSISMK